MKWHISAGLIALLCLGLICSSTGLSNPAQAAPAEERVTVLNPLGTPPAITLKPMAPRLDTLDGKTIYVVDDGFVGAGNGGKGMIPTTVATGELGRIFETQAEGVAGGRRRVVGRGEVIPFAVADADLVFQ